MIRAFPALLDEARKADADVRIAAVVADTGCVVGRSAYIDTSFSDSAAREALTAMADMDFERAPYGSNSERGFTLAYAAVDKRTNGSKCMADFWRDDSFWHWVHFSDEPEQSGPSWSTYVDFLAKAQGDADMTKIHAIVGDYPSGCGGAAPGTGYYEATVATGGAFLSFCADREDSLRTLAGNAFSRGRGLGDDRMMELSQIPVPGTIEVRVDGRLLSADEFEYVISKGAVILDASVPLDAGATVRVTYAVQPTCD